MDLSNFICPITKQSLQKSENTLIAHDVCHEIKGDIPRFVASDNYAEAFGLQWNTFKLTQFDSYTNSPVTEKRLEQDSDDEELDDNDDENESGRRLYPADFVKSKMLQTLKAWARDITMDHAKAVRQVYAVWHPDKFFGDVDTKECVNDIFQSLQAEVRKLMADKQRREEKFAKVKAEQKER